MMHVLHYLKNLKLQLSGLKKKKKSLGDNKNCIGLSSMEFKSRFYNHKQSFEHREKRHATELSKAVWRAKDAEISPSIEWCIASKARPYRSGAKACNLCLEEKLAILKSDPMSTLNKRSELIGKCRHRTKFKLKSLKPIRPNNNQPCISLL